MHGVPDDLDLSPFQDATLVQIGLGQNEVLFKFAAPAPDKPAPSITVESTWVLLDAAGKVVDQALREDQVPADRKEYRIHVLLSRRVMSAVVEPPHSIALIFKDGYTLRVFDDHTEYESFQIQPGDIVV